MSLSTVTIAVHQDEGTQCQSGQVRQVCSRALTGLVLRRPINISASFFLLTWTSDGCHGGGGRPATDRRAAAAAAPSFINVHHLNVIRHPVALVRVDTIRLSSLKFQSWDHLDSTFEALKRLIKNNCTYSGVQMISHHRLSGNVAFHSISWELQ